MSSIDYAEIFSRIAEYELLFKMDSTKDPGEYLLDPEGGDVPSNKYTNIPYSIVPIDTVRPTPSGAVPSGGVPEGGGPNICYTNLPIPTLITTEPNYDICAIPGQECQQAPPVRFSNGVWQR